MSVVTTHVLNIAAGEPARGVPVILKFRKASSESWRIVGQGITDAAGRLNNLMPQDQMAQSGQYCLSFDVASCSHFFPEISVCFVISDPGERYHIPLLLSEFGYTTYRGL
jgi:5-hydroxyisourate hydrolase